MIDNNSGKGMEQGKGRVLNRVEKGQGEAMGGGSWGGEGERIGLFKIGYQVDPDPKIRVPAFLDT